MHQLYVPLRLDGRLNRVKLTVREFSDGGGRHYAVDFVELKQGPDRYKAPAGSDLSTGCYRATDYQMAYERGAA